MNIQIEFIDKLGSDVSVVSAARVSFNQHTSQLSAKDLRLLDYLARNNHWSPFAHAVLTLRVTAPIFVARQLDKHQVGLTKNEISRRYVDTPVDFFIPDGWRQRPPQSIKQGSGLPLPEANQPYCDAVYLHALRTAQHAYDSLLTAGVAPEQARMVLPQSMLTTWIWTGSLYAFARVVNQRLDDHAQMETREAAKQIHQICAEHYPHAWHALTGLPASTSPAGADDAPPHPGH